MEKMSLQKFRESRNFIKNIIKRFEEQIEANYDDITEEEAMKLVHSYIEKIKELQEYDLSEIPFEEWEGMYLASKDFAIATPSTKSSIVA